jgi:hypothetical protein
MRFNSRVLGAATLFLTVAFFGAPAAFASDINLDPAAATHAVGEEFKVKVVIDPSGQSVNASDGTVSFDSSVLSVSQVSKDGSTFSLWTSDPTFSNTAGTVSFSGGTPSAFSKTGTVLTITFKGKKTGTAKVSVTKGSVLAADGKGTDTYKNGGSATYTITDAPAAAPDDGQTDDLGAVGPLPLAPNISSPTHPKEDQWYATSSAIFNWNILDEDTSVRILLSQNDNDAPKDKDALKKIATTTTIAKVPEGVSYFYVQLKNDSGWGAVAKRKIQVDTLPPKPFEVALQDGATPKFTFRTDDDGPNASGMDRYEIMLGASLAATVKVADLADGTYPVPPQDGGEQAVTIRAYDKANNKTEATKQLKLPKVAKPASPDAPAPQPFWTVERILLIIFSMVIGALIAWIMYARKNKESQKAMLLHRVSAMGDKNDRVFSAMREEFEAMINDLDPKPQLTPAERKFLEDTKEVLDLAEEQVDSGIDELKKILRGQ